MAWCYRRRQATSEGPYLESYTNFSCQVLTFSLSQSQPQVPMNPADPVLLVPTLLWGDWKDVR